MNNAARMKLSSTSFLRGVIVLIGLTVLALCVFWLPDMAGKDAASDPRVAYLQYPFLAYIYIGAIPFYIALYQALKLLVYIDKNNAFSELSIRALQNIKYCAFAIIALVLGGALFVALFVPGDRAHLMSIAFIIAFATTVIATFAALLQKLLHNAFIIKSENDLTV